MNIGVLLYNWRFLMKLNVRDAAKVVGISPSSFSRIERGYIPDGKILMALLNWLFAEQSKPENANAEATAAHAGR